MNHELVHVATMDQATRRDRMFRRLFGGKVNPIAEQPETILYMYLTAPRVAAPRWFHEGIAVFIDTWMAGGIGRAQSGYDEMVFRSMVRDDAHFYDPLGLVSEGTKVDFQLQINSYLYGTRFMMWLANTYGPEKLVDWVRRQEGSRGYYANHFRQIYGRSLDSAWAAWIASERIFQQKNLEAIRQHATTTYRDVSPRPLGSISRAFYDEKAGKLYAAFNYPGVVAHVGAIDVTTGELERIVDIKGPVIYTVTSLAYDPDSQQLFYTTDNGAHRDLVRVDPRTRQDRAADEGRAHRRSRVQPRRPDASGGSVTSTASSSLVRIAPPYKEWTRVHSFPYGTVVYDLDVSPDGTRLSASFGEIDGKQNVRVFSTERLLAGDVDAAGRVRFRSVGALRASCSRATAPRWSAAPTTPVSRTSSATTSRPGRSSALSATPRPGSFGRCRGPRATTCSCSATRARDSSPPGSRRPPLEDVSAITFFGERLVEAHPGAQELDRRFAQRRGRPEARAGHGALPAGRRPAARIDLPGGAGLQVDTQAVGVRANFSDPLQLNRLNLSASYSPVIRSPSDERLHLRADYQRYDWRARATLQRRRFLRSVRPDQDRPQGLHRSASATTGRWSSTNRAGSISIPTPCLPAIIDRLPQYQNVAVDVDRLFTFEATLKGSNIRSSLGRVDDEKGVRWSARPIDGTRAAGAVVSHAPTGRSTSAYPLALAHSSVWLRSAAGTSPGARDDPFANFYFGGFGNNWVDRGEAKRYREYYAFPGADLNEIGGRNFVKSTLEWNLPPLRFRRVGTPGFYVTWMRPAALRRRAAHQSGPRAAPAARVSQPRRAAGLPADHALGARHDVLGRRGGCLRGRVCAAPRVHGLAQGPSVESPSRC